ncbi:MAG: hypothetical protein ABSF89_09370 [Acidimicrobiales bacterium]|jgi:hypothetical protein
MTIDNGQEGYPVIEADVGGNMPGEVAPPWTEPGSSGAQSVNVATVVNGQVNLNYGSNIIQLSSPGEVLDGTSYNFLQMPTAAAGKSVQLLTTQDPSSAVERVLVATNANTSGANEGVALMLGPDGSGPAATGSAGAIDYFEFVSDDSNWYCTVADNHMEA